MSNDSDNVKEALAGVSKTLGDLASKMGDGDSASATATAASVKFTHGGQPLVMDATDEILSSPIIDILRAQGARIGITDATKVVVRSAGQVVDMSEPPLAGSTYVASMSRETKGS